MSSMTTSKPTASKTVATRVKAARVAIDAWEAATVEAESRAAKATANASNAAHTAWCFAFENAIKAINAAAKASGYIGTGGSVSHLGKLYSVVPCDPIPGMLENSKGELTIVSIDLAGVVEG